MAETVITLRAARAYRDAGIRYGLYRTLFVGSVILMVFGTIPFGLGVFMGIDWLVKTTCVLEGIPLVVMILSNAMMEFPHSPEITEEDIEAMHALNVPESVIRNTIDASIPHLCRESECEGVADA